MELDRRPDALMLHGLCLSYERAVLADIQIQRDGLIVEDSTIDEESGEKIVLRRRTHPAIAISRNAWAHVRGLCSEFGLSPVSRTRLSIEKRDDGSADLATLLSQPRQPRPSVN